MKLLFGENNITTNATNADLVLVSNGTGAVRTAPIVEIAGEDSLNGEIRFEDSNSSNYVAIKATRCCYQT